MRTQTMNGVCVNICGCAMKRKTLRLRCEFSEREPMLSSPNMPHTHEWRQNIHSLEQVCIRCGVEQVNNEPCRHGIMVGECVQCELEEE